MTVPRVPCFWRQGASSEDKSDRRGRWLGGPTVPFRTTKQKKAEIANGYPPHTHTHTSSGIAYSRMDRPVVPSTRCPRLLLSPKIENRASERGCVHGVSSPINTRPLARGNGRDDRQFPILRDLEFFLPARGNVRGKGGRGGGRMQEKREQVGQKGQ